MNFGRWPGALELVEGGLELVGTHPVAVHRDLHHVGLVGENVGTAPG